MDGQTAAVGTGAVALSAGAYSIGFHGWVEWLVILLVVYMVLKVIGVDPARIWSSSVLPGRAGESMGGSCPRH